MLTIIGAGKWPGLLSPAQSFSKATAARRKIAVSMFGEKNTWTSFHVFIFHLKNSQIFFPYDRGRKYHFHNWVYLYSKACQSCRICMDCGSNIIECGHMFVFFLFHCFVFVCLCFVSVCLCFVSVLSLFLYPLQCREYSGPILLSAGIKQGKQGISQTDRAPTQRTWKLEFPFNREGAKNGILVTCVW